MKIRSIALQNFRRFTNLSITGLPESTKLVVLIGPNGCGKSSLLDALHGKAVVEQHWGWDDKQTSQYWNKKYTDEDDERLRGNPGQRIQIQFHGTPPTDKASWRRALYARSAYRNDPVAEARQLARVPTVTDEYRIQRMIDNDAAVSSNYQRLVSTGCEYAFDQGPDTLSLGQFREQLIGAIRDAVRSLFDDPALVMDSLGSPLTDGTFRFSKGRSQRFPYANLSGGEKAAFDLILDVVLKVQELSATVFCIDEPEAHLGLRLQGRLLDTLCQVIPDECQLWIATHSVGMLRAAHSLEQSKPGTVVFLDFTGRDFDQPQTIEPATVNRTTWESMHKVVLEDLAALIAPSRVVLCEGKPGVGGLDAECYNRIFAEEHADTMFVSTGGKGEAGNYRAVVKAITGAEVVQLRDKDNLSRRQAEELKQDGVRILNRTKLEDYLLDDEVLSALSNQHASGDGIKAKELLDLKARKLTEKHGDAKAIVEDVRKWVIGSLGVGDAGDNRDSFLRDTVAPLIKPSMRVYAELERDIFSTS